MTFVKPYGSGSPHLACKLLRWTAALAFALIAGGSAAAQTSFTCSFSLSPASGTAPVTVTAAGGCSDTAAAIASETLDWGDGNQTPIPPSSFGSFSVTHNYTVPGTYTATLTATDLLGGTATFTQTETVNANSPPSCTLGVNPNSGNAPLDVTATGSCSDPDGDIQKTVIDWGDGTNTSGTSGTHRYTSTGTFTVTLTATDSVGHTGSASQTVSVSTGNRAPTCTLSVNPSGGQAPLPVNASGSCSDPDNNISSMVLNWGDGTTSPGPSGSHTFGAAGTFTVTLTATDAGGLTGSAAKDVHVSSKNAPPTCVLSVAPTAGPAPLSVNANGSCSDPENNIVSTVLNWGDGTTLNGTDGSHRYTTVGTYRLVLTATDSASGTGSATQTVVVGSGVNAPPHCSMTVSTNSGQVPLVASVTANCSDPENDISTTVISFGDGFYTNGASASHTYNRSGSFNATVTATDTVRNVSNVAASTVNVSDKPTLFVGVSNGQVKQFDRAGKLLKTLNTNQGGSVTGMAFDWFAALYVTDFSANAVTRFNGNGNVAGNFGSGYDCKPESIVFDHAGNAYVGETGCSHALLKFDAYGNLAAAYSVATEVEGSDWIDLARDQCTVFYTSQGTTIFRFNACTGQQLSPFATNLTTGLAVKILPDDSVLAANQKNIFHFDSGGRVIGKYSALGENCWVSLALDPDGKTFWAVDYCSSDVVQFDIASGKQFAKFDSGTPAQSVYGVGIRQPAAPTTPAGPLIASNQNLMVSAGQTASFDLAFSPVPGGQNQTYTFSCANLPVGAQCTFSPQTALVTSSGATVHVTITTTGASELTSMLFRNAFMWPAMVAGIFLIGGRRRLPRRKAHRRGAILVVFLLSLLLGCSASSKSNNNGNQDGSIPKASSTTPASNYTVLLRATSGSLESATAVNLTVQ